MGKAAKKTTTNGKTTMKGDGIDKGKQRQGKIRESKPRDRNDEEDREKAENLRKAREEEEKAENLRKAREEEEKAENLRKAREEEAAMLKEKQKRNSKFGNLMFLVIEFPKGGNSWFHKYKKFMRSVSLVPPCLIKGVYTNIGNKKNKRDPDIGNRMELIYLGIDKTSFVPLDEYDENLRDFLEYFMPNMGEPANYLKRDTQRDIDWFIAFYWRMQWLKHGLYHGIAEIDYYWKIYHLYLKASVDDILYNWWSFDAGYYDESSTTPPCTAEITVMACKGSILSHGIRNYTKHRPAICANSRTKGLSKIYIGFDGNENIVNVPFDFGSKGFWNLDLYV